MAKKGGRLGAWVSFLFPKFSFFEKVMSVINVEDHAAHCRMAREIITTPLLKNPMRSIYRKPAVHQNGWFISATRMFQRAEGRVVLLVYITLLSVVPRRDIG